VQNIKLFIMLSKIRILGSVGITQWKSTCLVYTRPWVHPPAPKKRKIKFLTFSPGS
jgi:hypothetical protein